LGIPSALKQRCEKTREKNATGIQSRATKNGERATFKRTNERKKVCGQFKNEQTKEKNERAALKTKERRKKNS